MKSRDFFLPSLSGVLVAGLIVFQSCAHQSRNSEDVDVPSEDVYSESDVDQESSPNSEASVADNELESSSSSEDHATKSEDSGDLLAESESLDNQNKDADSLEKDLETDSASTEMAPQKDNNNLEAQNTSKEPSFEDELENDMPSQKANTEASKDLLADNFDLDAESAKAPSQKPEALSPSMVQPKTDELEARDSIAPQIDPIVTTPAEPVKRSYKRTFGAIGTRVPKIPAKAITKKGKKLNRFYFVRKGDTAKKVSSLIYGTENNAKSLTLWNGASWTPGKLIYYISPKNPKDMKMESYYKENGVVANAYQVRKGDWLSKIAGNQLGDPKSWVEIAVVNGIQSPKSLEVGQKIAIYPKDLTPPPAEPVVAKTEPEPAPVVAQAQPVTPPPAVVPPTEPSQPAEPAAEAAPKEPVTSKAVNFDAQKFIEQNMFAGLMGLAGFFLLLLLVVKKRRKAREAKADDFDNGEEGFQPPTKLKRR